MSAVLSEFAHNLSMDFPIQGILDHLVEGIVDVLPISAAGVTAIEPGLSPRYVAASDAAALRYEQLQTDLSDGPCVMAYSTGEPVCVPDLSLDDRFPMFSKRAIDEGLVAVFAFPLRHGAEQFGALDLYRHSAGGLGVADLSAAQTLAEVASAYLLNAWARERDFERSERYRQTSLRDALTDLPNRLFLEQRLERAAAGDGLSHRTAALLYVDLDEFKQINDTYGHSTGDALLVAVARRLSRLVRPTDTLARMSGDEFVILCEDLRTAADAERLARRVSEAFTFPFELDQVQIAISCSVGVAFAGAGHDVARRLLHDADTAMYQAKRDGGAQHQLFDNTRASVAADRLLLERDLRLALSENHLTVSYQPIVRSADGLVTGVEALVRWSHPTRGWVPPQSIVAAAERNGLIVELGTWVLETACEQRRIWATHRQLDLAVNVSAVQLMTPGFADVVDAILRRTRTDPATVILEVTEDVLIEDTERAMAVLGQLKDMGLRLALDDFGTGYSSLNYLRRFPVDIVKIDRDFVTDLESDAANRAIVQAVTGLAHVLNLHVIAEGIETDGQREQVVQLGCESAQGFFYSRPLSAGAFAAELALADSPLHLPLSALAERGDAVA